ncbi:MAG: single-stranded DNA-binding protein [Breznakia sp.]
MLNQIVIVGKVKEMPELKETNSSIKYALLTLDVNRNFKNSEGVFESDTIVCTLWRGIAESCLDVCEVGSLVGIKGRLQSRSYTNEENRTFINYEVIAEKVSFLDAKQ